MYGRNMLPKCLGNKGLHFLSIFPVICYPKFEITSGMKWFEQRKKDDKKKKQILYFFVVWSDFERCAKYLVRYTKILGNIRDLQIYESILNFLYF